MKQSKIKVMPVELHGDHLIEQSDFPLWGVIFHYNHHNKLWYCINRVNYVDYFNGRCKEKYGQGETLVSAYRNYCIKTKNK